MEETTDGGARERGTWEGETTGAEHLQPSNAEGQLYCAILYKGLEHPWILVSLGSWDQSPVDTEGRLYTQSLSPALLPNPSSSTYHQSMMNTFHLLKRVWE